MYAIELDLPYIGGAFVFSMMHPLVTSVAGRKPLRILNNMSWDDSGVAISEPIGFQVDYYHDIGKRNATFIGHGMVIALTLRNMNVLSLMIHYCE